METSALEVRNGLVYAGEFSRTKEQVLAALPWLLSQMANPGDRVFGNTDLPEDVRGCFNYGVRFEDGHVKIGCRTFSYSQVRKLSKQLGLRRFKTGDRVRVVCQPEHEDWPYLRSMVGKEVTIDSDAPNNPTVYDYTTRDRRAANWGWLDYYFEPVSVGGTKPEPGKFGVGDRVKITGNPCRASLPEYVGTGGIVTEVDPNDGEIRVKCDKDGDTRWYDAGSLEKVAEESKTETTDDLKVGEYARLPVYKGAVVMKIGLAFDSMDAFLVMKGKVLRRGPGNAVLLSTQAIERTEPKKPLKFRK